MADRHESRWRDIFPENAALLPRDWREIFPEESLPFENAQDMFEGLRQELGLPRPPENTQQHLTENAQQHEAEVEHSGDELEAEAESPNFRESEMPKEAGSETAELDEEDSRPQELAPEESKRQEQLPEESSREPEVPDDEDSNRRELVPEEVMRQELLPEESKRLGEESEAYVVFFQPRHWDDRARLRRRGASLRVAWAQAEPVGPRGALKLDTDAHSASRKQRRESRDGAKDYLMALSEGGAGGGGG